MQAPTALPLLPPEPRLARPYGFWATLGLGVACLLFWIAITTDVLVIYASVDPQIHGISALGEKVEHLGANGLVLGLATVIANPICIALVVLFIWLKRCHVADYLGLKRLRAKEVLVSLGVLILYIVAQDLTTHFLGKPIVPPFMTDAYRTAGWLPVLVAALVVAAPAFEETLFRGFAFQGIAQSRLRPTGAILITAAAWAGIHMQYDLYGMAAIFVMGLFLGIVRHKTGSVSLTILLHAFSNLGATAETVIVVDYLGK